MNVFAFPFVTHLTARRLTLRFLMPLAALTLLLAGCFSAGVDGSDRQSVALALNGSAPAAGTTVRNRSLPAAVAAAYRGRSLLWYEANGRPSVKGYDLYDLLANSSGHGLRPDAYLPTDLLQAGSLPHVSGAAIRLYDTTLSLGLYRFAQDFAHGRGNPSRPGGAGAFRSALASSSFRAWVAATEPKGKSYLDLRNRLRSGTLSPVQASTLALNMDRLRWVRETPWSGPIIRVNVADAILETFNGTRRVDTMRVVTGRASRQTPGLVDVIEDLKFSPDWTVPPTIVARDFLPRLRENPNYLNANEYYVRINGKPPSQVRNWSNVRPEDVYIRRISSDTGPLGGVRFSMYNSGSIFLHDTPSKGLFERDFRAYSSGCVRVQRAEDLSVWIMSFQSARLSREEVAARMASGDTTTFKLSRPIPVLLQYLTAYVDGTGQLRFTGDPYSRDAGVARALGLARIGQRSAVPAGIEYDLGP